MLQFGASLTVVIDDASQGLRPRLGSSIMNISSFILQANVITIVNYNRKTFMVQATDYLWSKVDSFTACLRRRHDIQH
jgi:hypothetical protein